MFNFIVVLFIRFEMLHCARRTKYGCDTSYEELPQGCILDKILELQRHTDIRYNLSQRKSLVHWLWHLIAFPRLFFPLVITRQNSCVINTSRDWKNCIDSQFGIPWQSSIVSDSTFYKGQGVASPFWTVCVACLSSAVKVASRVGVSGSLADGDRKLATTAEVSSLRHGKRRVHPHHPEKNQRQFGRARAPLAERNGESPRQGLRQLSTARPAPKFWYLEKIFFLKIPVGGTSFRLMISVIDLDPKPIHRLSTWIKKKEDWLRIYQQTLDPDTRPLESDIPKCEELVAVWGRPSRHTKDTKIASPLGEVTTSPYLIPFGSISVTLCANVSSQPAAFSSPGPRGGERGLDPTADASVLSIL